MNPFQVMFNSGGPSEAFGLKPWNYGKPTLFNSNRYTRLLNRILRNQNRMFSVYNELMRLETSFTFCRANSEAHFQAIRSLKSLIIAHRGIPTDDKPYELTCFVAQVSHKMSGKFWEAMVLKCCLVGEGNIRRRLRLARKVAPAQDQAAIDDLEALQADIVSRLRSAP